MPTWAAQMKRVTEQRHFRRLPMPRFAYSITSSVEKIKAVDVCLKLVGSNLQQASAAVCRLRRRHHCLQRHHLPIDHLLLVGSPGMVAVADPGAVEAPAAAASLCAPACRRVVVGVLVLAPAASPRGGVPISPGSRRSPRVRSSSINPSLSPLPVVSAPSSTPAAQHPRALCDDEKEVPAGAPAVFAPVGVGWGIKTGPDWLETQPGHQRRPSWVENIIDCSQHHLLERRVVVSLVVLLQAVAALTGATGAGERGGRSNRRRRGAMMQRGVASRAGGMRCKHGGV